MPVAAMTLMPIKVYQFVGNAVGTILAQRTQPGGGNFQYVKAATCFQCYVSPKVLFAMNAFVKSVYSDPCHRPA